MNETLGFGWTRNPNLGHRKPGDCLQCLVLIWTWWILQAIN